MDIREKIEAEFSRMIAGGTFNEGFWESLYAPSRDEMNRARNMRDAEIYDLIAIARELEKAAANGDVKTKRGARKAREKVRRFQGAIRARRDLRAPDPIHIAWQKSVKWIEEARSAAIHIQRMNNELRAIPEGNK